MSFQDRGMINRMSLPEILQAIGDKIGMNADEVQSVLKNSEKEELTPEVGNEWDELVLDDMDPQDKPEFREVQEAIDAKRSEKFQEEWAIVRKSMIQTRKRGRPKKRRDCEKNPDFKNVKVNSKWIRKPWKKRPPPVNDKAEDGKKQRTSSSLHQPENNDANVPDLLEARQETSDLPDDGHLPASDLSTDVVVPNQGNTSTHEGGSSELAAIPNEGGSSEPASSSHQGEPFNVGEANAMIVPVEAPRSPAASQVSMASRTTHRVRSRAESLVWQSVFCPICDCEYGQFKHDPSPGERDPATWTYRVADEQGALFVLQICVNPFNYSHFCQVCGLLQADSKRGDMLG